VGCGGAANEPSLAEAAERTEAQGTGRFEMRGVQKEDDGSGQIACRGEADYSAKRVRLDCDYPRLGALEVIAIGSDSYARGALFGTGTDKWVKSTGEEDDDDALQSLSPQKLLRILREASSETERLGEEEIRGVDTVGYRLTVDCDAALLSCDSTAPVDVWVGEDGIVRRIEIDDDDGSYSFEFFDFGAEVTIEPPPVDEVVDESALGSGSGSSESGSCSAEAEPITVERAESALRAHGFPVKRDESGCSGSLVVTLSTMTNPGPSTVTCFVFSGAEHPNSSAGVDIGGRDVEKVDRRLENVECTLFFERGHDEAVARLDAALAELRR
jgi:hypothetical protein